MTDQLHLFRDDSLRETSKVNIQVGGGRLISNQRGTARVDALDGTSMYLDNVLFVPSLGINLLSAKKLCKNGLKGSFDEDNIRISDRNKTVITAKQTCGLYVVNHISKRMCNTKMKYPKAVPALMVSDQEHTDFDPDDSEPELATTKAQRHWYRLMHRRFNHCGPGMLRKLHLVTS